MLENKIKFSDILKQNRMALILILIFLILICVSASIVLNINNNKQTEIEKNKVQIENIQAVYKNQGVMLESNMITIEENGDINIEEDISNEYKQALNEKIKGIIKKRINFNAVDNDDDSDSIENDDSNDNDDENNGKDIPVEIDTLLTEVNSMLNNLKELWYYFDNSQYIDMNNGQTYLDTYTTKVNSVYQKQKEIWDSHREEHSEMNDGEYEIWFLQNKDKLGVPIADPWDDSKIDIDENQVVKAWGMLSYTNKWQNQDDNTINYYKNSMSQYILNGEINSINEFEFQNRTENPLYNTMMSNQLYLKDLNLNPSLATVKLDDSISFNNNLYKSTFRINVANVSLIYGLNNSELILLDIEEV